jgi:hypothetical protein
VIAVAVQYYTELVAVKGSALYIFAEKRISHNLGDTDDINRDTVSI